MTLLSWSGLGIDAYLVRYVVCLCWEETIMERLNKQDRILYKGFAWFRLLLLQWIVHALLLYSIVVRVRE